MTFTINPTEVVAVWDRTVMAGRSELAGTLAEHSRAVGNLADLGPGVANALARLEGATETAMALVDELSANVTSCLAAYAATDRKSAGVFNGLTR
jgi:kynureninase